MSMFIVGQNMRMASSRSMVDLFTKELNTVPIAHDVIGPIETPSGNDTIWLLGQNLRRIYDGTHTKFIEDAAKLGIQYGLSGPYKSDQPGKPAPCPQHSLTIVGRNMHMTNDAATALAKFSSITKLSDWEAEAIGPLEILDGTTKHWVVGHNLHRFYDDTDVKFVQDAAKIGMQYTILGPFKDNRPDKIASAPTPEPKPTPAPVEPTTQVQRPWVVHYTRGNVTKVFFYANREVALKAAKERACEHDVDTWISRLDTRVTRSSEPVVEKVVHDVEE